MTQILNPSWLVFELNQLEVQKDQHILLAMSAGADSTALFHLLRSCPYQFSVAHVNYNLRDEDSINDAHFVKSLCKTFNIEFYEREVAPGIKVMGNLQEWARNIRYQFFREVAKDHQIDFICTGHHLDDQYELFLMNFVRGSGVQGLTGMKKKSVEIIRPFLDVSKSDIFNYLREK